ncbi:MAG TPA: transketolase, partial [Bacteroidota bacterium]|nr:transketolase [Bacteroidota bacterium]
VSKAIDLAKAEQSRPSIIITRTHIGYGSPNKQDTSEAHGSPLGDDEIKLTKKAYGWDPEKQFFVPEEARQQMSQIQTGAEKEAAWNKLFAEYKKQYPELAAELEKIWVGEFGDAWKKAIPVFTESMATRDASGKTLAAIFPQLPTMLGGSADLTPSNNTFVKGTPDFQANNRSGRYIRYGVREHAMAGIMNGLALTDGIIPYGGTFFVFSDYMRGSMRLASIMGIRPIYVLTHDSIGVGEDGPTHQPIEHLASLRIIPNMTLIRPADANETAIAWRVAIEHKTGPVALALTRQKLPTYDRTKFASAEGVVKGAYVLIENSPLPEIILIGSGSEVQFAVAAYEQLVKDHVKARVVSFPSWELFERQSKEYRDSVFPPSVKKRVAIEAGVPFGWEKYVGDAGKILAISTFGISAPFEAVYKHFGLTVENVLATAKELL